MRPNAALKRRRDLRDTQLHARAVRVHFFSKRFIYATMREVSDKRAPSFPFFREAFPCSCAHGIAERRAGARGHFTARLFNVNEPCNETRVAHNPTIPSPICRQTKRISRCCARPNRDLTRPPRKPLRSHPPRNFLSLSSVESSNYSLR